MRRTPGGVILPGRSAGLLAMMASRGTGGWRCVELVALAAVGDTSAVVQSREGRRTGVLISMEDGVSVAYAIFNLEDRGKFFIGSGEQVYTGMILGEHSRDNDLEVNPLKGKKLTNVRASGTDEAVRLTTPVRMTRVSCACVVVSY